MNSSVHSASFSSSWIPIQMAELSATSKAQIIAELVALAKEVSADANRGTTFAPPLNTDELAFYDAVAQNESAVTEMGTTVLADIARELVRTLRRDVTTDWVARDDVRAKIRSTIKRLLAKYGYPQTPRPTPSSASSTRWKPSPTTGPQKPRQTVRHGSMPSA